MAFLESAQQGTTDTFTNPRVAVRKILGFFSLLIAIAGSCVVGILLLAGLIVKVEPLLQATPTPPDFARTSPVVGDRAPDFVLQSFDGGTVRLSDAVGPRPIVIEFGSFS